MGGNASGGGSENTISFTISGEGFASPVTLKADPDMTWDEWVDSDYNTVNFFIFVNFVVDSAGNNIHLNNSGVLRTDTIVSGATYEIVVEDDGP